jgi:hypothetical protein
MPTEKDLHKLLVALGPFTKQIRQEKGWLTTIEVDAIKLYNYPLPDNIPEATKAGNLVIALGIGKNSDLLKTALSELKKRA